MKRRAFVAASILAPTLLAHAQTTSTPSTATQLQIDLALAHVSLAALRTRYGEAHSDVVAARGRIASLADSLRSSVAHGDRVDALAVARALDAELADVRARLGEFSSRCRAGHPDMASAHAREAALEDALAHVTSEGRFFPP